MPISAFIIAKNEEKNIRECLQSLKFADEIIVVDSGSTDNTSTIAKEYTDKVFARAFDDFASQKNFALSKTSREWAISLDADERVTPELAQEILKTVQQPNGKVCYRIPRQTYFLKKRLRFSGTQKDKPARLFKRGSGKFEQPIHEFFSANGEVGDLKTSILHYTTPSVAKEKEKTEFYTDIEAVFLRNKKTAPPPFTAFLKSIAVFFYYYLWQWGFLDGREGFLFAYFSARYNYRKYHKLREFKKREELEPKIQERFDGHAVHLPDQIEVSDSRLQALLRACGDVRGKKVLDVGCGKGRFAAVLINRGAELTGIDPSSALIEEAKKINGGVFLQGSATALPFPDETFDTALAVEVIEHLPFLERSIQEMSRVLKRGGRLILIDRNKYSINQRRFLAPNVVIKRWHEMRNHWIYPNDFPFRERWFSRNQVLKQMKPYFEALSAEHIESDGEKRCGWHLLFDRLPALRLFILWKGEKK